MKITLCGLWLKHNLYFYCCLTVQKCYYSFFKKQFYFMNKFLLFILLFFIFLTMSCYGTMWVDIKLNTNGIVEEIESNFCGNEF